MLKDILLVHSKHLYFNASLNLVTILLTFFQSLTGRGYGSIVPDAPGAETHCLTKTLAEKVGKYVEQYLEDMEKVTVNFD